ncbi:MAG: hypothetical protein GY825_11205, partial [Phycisphaeraceae bacterium]|nr:hypothetical protein [Phycisphaeraceae bacterium]
DTDTDADGIADCDDPCPNWPYDCNADGSSIDVAVGQSIQQAIDASSDGGTVQLSAGTHQSGTIDPGGREIVIRGAVGLTGTLLTTIDTQGGGSTAVFQSGEGRGTQLRDLVLTGGVSTYGGGIECSNGSSPTITGCIITGNTATEYGGGINCWLGSNPLIDSCTISGNSATLAGGGLSIDQSAPTIVDCLIDANVAPEAGGVYAVKAPDTTIENTLVCGNTAEPFVGVFDDLGENCFATSCEDDNEDGVVDECRPCVGDLNGDRVVDGGDLAFVLGAWGTDSDVGDINEDGFVGGADLSFILSYWGDCLDH